MGWVLADSHNGYFKQLQFFTEHGFGPESGEDTAKQCGKHNYAFFDNSPLRSFCKICWPTVCTHVEPQEPTLKQVKLPTSNSHINKNQKFFYHTHICINMYIYKHACTRLHNTRLHTNLPNRSDSPGSSERRRQCMYIDGPKGGNGDV